MLLHEEVEWPLELPADAADAIGRLLDREPCTRYRNAHPIICCRVARCIASVMSCVCMLHAARHVAHCLASVLLHVVLRARRCRKLVFTLPRCMLHAI